MTSRGIAETSGDGRSDAVQEAGLDEIASVSDHAAEDLALRQEFDWVRFVKTPKDETARRHLLRCLQWTPVRDTANQGWYSKTIRDLAATSGAESDPRTGGP